MFEVAFGHDPFQFVREIKSSMDVKWVLFDDFQFS